MACGLSPGGFIFNAKPALVNRQNTRLMEKWKDAHVKCNIQPPDKAGKPLAPRDQTLHLRRIVSLVYESKAKPLVYLSVPARIPLK